MRPHASADEIEPRSYWFEEAVGRTVMATAFSDSAPGDAEDVA
jgi:hypothetical protein